MSEPLRGVLSGLVLGVVPLLLLDLAQQLQGDATTSSGWWALGVYLLIGGIVAAGVGLGRRGPWAPGTAAIVLALSVASVQPLVPVPSGFQVPVLTDAARLAPELVVVVAAALAVAAARGSRM
ncbi:hypothetical protein FTX61_00770 [Nitriliruptoraceae bacterium ZYF776]|nr:hypothetical protein [Profundirhabdus halotolerans]